jgi:hypothetical protein
MEMPAFDLFLAFVLTTLKACGLCVDSPPIFLEDDVLSGGGTDHVAQPAQVGRAPGGPARVAEIVPQQKGFEAKLGGLEIPKSLLTGAGEGADGLILDRWPTDRRELPSPHGSDQLDSITAVGFDSVPSPSGAQGGGDDPAGIAFSGEIAGEPVATRAGFVDKNEILAFGQKRAEQRIDVTLAGADRAEIDTLGVVFLADVGNRTGLCMDVQSNVERARLWHG